MRVMISQPMKGLTTEQIVKNREQVVNFLTEAGHEVVNTIFTEEPPTSGNEALWYLGESLKAMATCDAVYFMEGWESARGCKLEHQACEDYGIQILLKQ